MRTVYAVVYDALTDPHGGPAGDGTLIARFARGADADEWARGRTHLGRPAVVVPERVPKRLALRWGLA